MCKTYSCSVVRLKPLFSGKNTPVKPFSCWGKYHLLLQEIPRSAAAATARNQLSCASIVGMHGRGISRGFSWHMVGFLCTAVAAILNASGSQKIELLFPGRQENMATHSCLVAYSLNWTVSPLEDRSGFVLRPSANYVCVRENVVVETALCLTLVFSYTVISVSGKWPLAAPSQALYHAASVVLYISAVTFPARRGKDHTISIK